MTDTAVRSPAHLTPTSPGTESASQTDSARTMLDLAVLYREQRAYVRACLVSCRVPDAALQDAIQDVFVVLFRRASDFDDTRGTLRAWLFGISFRVALQHRRKAGRPTLPPDMLHAEDAVADPESYASQLRAAELATEILDTLPREQLSVLVLSEIEGLTGPEIATALDLQLGTVHSRLSRARKRVAAECQRRRQDEGMEARPWFALLAIKVRGLMPSRTKLPTAAFVSVQTLRGILVVVGLVFAAVIAFRMQGSDAPTAESEPPPDATPPLKAQGLSRDGSESTTPQSGLRTASIRGTVTDVSGTRITGATACAWVESESLLNVESRVPRCATSDTSGDYELRGLMASRYRVTGAAVGKLPAQYKPETGAAFFPLGGGQDRTGVDITLTAGGVALRGVVSDVTGGPVPGAIVMARDSTNGSPLVEGSWGRLPPALIRTNDEGAFELWVHPGQVRLMASSEGYARAETLVVAPGLSARLVMSPESVIAGRVVDRVSGKPVAGARILASGHGPVAQGAGSAVSDASGHYRIVGLDPGRYRPVASAKGRLGDAKASVDVGLAETVENVTIEMVGAPTVRGRIVTDGDRPCSAGVLALQGTSRGQTFVATVDTDGWATIDAVVPDTYNVLPACHGYASAKPVAPLSVGDDDLLELRWQLTAGSTIRGRVVSSDDTAVADAQVTAFATGKGASPMPITTYSAADGGFELSGAMPGSYSVKAHDVHLGDAGLDEVTVGDADVSVRLQIPVTRAIRGVVSNSAGDAIAGVNVSIPRTSRRTLSLDDGTFELQGLVAGDYVVSARVSDGDEVSQASATVSADADGEVELVLPERDATIAGMVRDEDGDLVRDAIITVLPDKVMKGRGRRDAMRHLRGLSDFGRGRAPVLTNAEGQFEIDVSEQETYTVLAQRRGGGDAWTSGVTSSSEVVLTIPARCSIAGHITTSDGEGASGLSIRLRNAESGVSLSEMFLHDQGAFRFDGLGAGTYELTAVAAQGRAQTKLTLTSGVDQTELALPLVGSVSVRGQVVDVLTGESVEGMNIIIGPEDDEVGEFAAKAEVAAVFGKTDYRTDADGRFELTDVPPGNVRVMVLSEKMGKGPYGIAMFVTAEVGYDSVNTMQPIPIHPKPVGPFAETGLSFQRDGQWCVDSPIVGKVAPGSRAHAAGLSEGDIVVEVNGHDVRGQRCHLAGRLVRVPVGGTVELKLEGGTRATVRTSSQ